MADLHTVDYGVYEKVPLEMENTDWKLLIGHLLGVDHCGHTFGPLTHHIGEKLLEVDDFIEFGLLQKNCNIFTKFEITPPREKTIQNLDEDTILLAFGDHGMTITGDHGGESKDETGAGLYVYAPKGFKGHQSEHINQIDISSTVPLLLGAAIPFNSLGTPITDLFGDETSEYQIVSQAYRQIVQYLNEYARQSSGGGAIMDRMIPHHELNSTQNIREFIESARGQLRRVWAEFDLFTMSIGALLVMGL